MASQFTFEGRTGPHGRNYDLYKSKHPDATLILHTKDEKCTPVVAVQIFYQHTDGDMLLCPRKAPADDSKVYFAGIGKHAEKAFQFHIENLTDERVGVTIFPGERALPLNQINALRGKQAYTIPVDRSTGQALALKARLAPDGQTIATVAEEEEKDKKESKKENYFRVVVQATMGSNLLKNGSFWVCAPGYIKLDERPELRYTFGSRNNMELGPSLSAWPTFGSNLPTPAVHTFGYNVPIPAVMGPPLHSYLERLPHSSHVSGRNPMAATFGSPAAPRDFSFGSAPVHGPPPASAFAPDSSAFDPHAHGPILPLASFGSPVDELDDKSQSIGSINFQSASAPRAAAAPPAFETLKAADIISVGPKVDVHSVPVDVEFDTETANTDAIICMCLADELDLPPYKSSDWEKIFVDAINAREAKEFHIPKIHKTCDSCTICMDEEQMLNSVIAQCGHVCVCDDCWKKAKLTECTLCRGLVRAFLPLSAFA